MRPLLVRAASVACALGLLLAACSSGEGKPSPTGTPRSVLPSISGPSDPTLQACEYPKRAAFPTWMPRDLPLPPGTYVYEEFPETRPYFAAVFAVKMQLGPLVKFILEEWPKMGWFLARGDAEASEVEDSFSKPPAYGAFKAQDQRCTPGFSVLLIFYAPKGLVSSPASPITNPGSPLLSPTPS